MTRPADIGQLNTTNWDQLEQLADRFEKAWRQAAAGADPPDLAGFLPAAADPIRIVVLHELVKVEMEARWRLGQPTSLESYLARFPELGGPKEVSATLIFEEYRVRQVYGDKPALTVYQGRFPGQFTDLKKLHEDNPQPTVSLAPATKANIPTPPPPRPAGAAAAASQVKGPQAQVATVAANADATTVIGDYKLSKRIGSGTFGEVWRAEAPGGVPVAVKIVIRPVDHEEAQRELAAMELIKQLQHPFLLQTHRFQAIGDRLMIVMELADGSLRDRAKQRRKEGKPGIPAPELVRYFKESAEALDFLHQNKVLHRDIKPENILLLKGHAKVADFGLARTQGGASMFSATGCGTPAYMAPEVWRGKAAEQTDQYSLAVAYAELRLDRRLFTGTDFAQLMFAHLENTPDLKPLPEDEQKVIFKAISKEPNKRYKNCQEFVEALEDALGDLIRRPSPSTANLRAPGASSKNYSSAGTDALGTVGRQALPSKVQSQGTEDWREEKKKSGSALGTIVVLLLLAGFGYGGWRLFGPKDGGPNPTHGGGALRLGDLQPMGLQVGEKKRVILNITRPSSDPVLLSFADVPPHLEIAPVDAKAEGDKFKVDGESVFLDITAGDHIEPNEYTIKVKGESGDDKHDREFCVTVSQLSTLPAGCEKDPNAVIVTDKTGMRFYQRVLAGPAKVPFLAILSAKDGDPATFYIMETKVPVSLFRRFAKEKSSDVRNNEWEGVAKKHGNEQYPVLKVYVEDADRFSRWLGGKLPSPQQWDKAAGRFEQPKRSGPFEADWNSKAQVRQIAVNRGTPEKPDPPMPVGEATKDISALKVKDMAGNGREWTRSIQGTTETVPLTNATFESVVLRGRAFEEPGPLLFAEMDFREKGRQPYDSIEYSKSDLNISFRVVIEPK